MLIGFAVTNFRSIRERQEIRFTSVGQVGQQFLPDNLTDTDNPLGKRLLRSAVFYGANAAGKSNFLMAFKALENLVLKSDGFKLDKPIPVYAPYKLDNSSRDAPTIFEIDFVAKNGLRYIYSVAFNKFSIIKEKLSYFERNRRVFRSISIFTREQGRPIVFDSYEGKKDFALNDNQLLLSQAGSTNLPSLVNVYRFFSSYLFNVPAQTLSFDEKMLEKAEKFLSVNSEDIALRNAIISIVKAADTGISDIVTEEIDNSKIKLPDEMPDQEKQRILDRFKRRIKTIHPVYIDGIEVGTEVFDLTEESTGTIKLVSVASFIADALSDGSVVIVDELDKNLHPLLTRMLIGLFHNPEINKHDAQLIFSSHDISLIDKDLFRRDQIFIANKDIQGVTEISRLSDYTGISKVISLQKWYMAGMFKGIPSINEYEINLG
jgi:AAA15 family ATPase/GTPase